MKEQINNFCNVDPKNTKDALCVSALSLSFLWKIRKVQNQKRLYSSQVYILKQVEVSRIFLNSASKPS